MLHVEKKQRRPLDQPSAILALFGYIAGNTLLSFVRRLFCGAALAAQTRPCAGGGGGACVRHTKFLHEKPVPSIGTRINGTQAVKYTQEESVFHVDERNLPPPSRLWGTRSQKATRTPNEGTSRYPAHAPADAHAPAPPSPRPTPPSLPLAHMAEPLQFLPHTRHSPAGGLSSNVQIRLIDGGALAHAALDQNIDDRRPGVCHRDKAVTSAWGGGGAGG